VLYEKIINIQNLGRSPPTSLYHSPRLINFVEIFDNDVVSFNSQYVECGKLEK